MPAPPDDRNVGEGIVARRKKCGARQAPAMMAKRGEPEGTEQIDAQTVLRDVISDRCGTRLIGRGDQFHLVKAERFEIVGSDPELIDTFPEIVA